MVIRLLIGAACLLAAAATAQAQPARPLTLDGAVDLALERNVFVVQARNRFDGTSAATRAAWGGLLPSLNTFGSFSRVQQWQKGGVTVINGVPVPFPDGFNAYNNYRAGISSRVTIFDGFATTSDISRARSNAASSMHAMRRTEQEVILQTHVLFLGVARASQLLKVADDDVKRSRRQLERITESNKVGAVALADVYRQRVQVGTDELAVIQAQSNFESAKADLIAYLGVEFDEQAWQIDVSGVPVDVDTAEFAGLNARYADFDALVATGVATRPDHQAAADALHSASSSVVIARAGHMPSLTAGGSFGYSNSEFNSLTDNRNLSLDLSVSLPIFNGFSTSNAVEQAKVQERNSREDLEQSKRRIAVEIRKALLNLQEAEKRIIVTSTSVASAEMDRKIAEEKYNLGAGTLLDMLVATASYTNAVSSRVNAVVDFLLAKKSIEHALGTIAR